MSEKPKIPVIAGIIRRLSGYGPGLRTVVFFKGCPMACPDCARPELKYAQEQLLYNPVYCTGCRACVSACARGLHTFDDDCVHHVKLSGCDACFACVRACKTGALTACGEEYSPEGLGKVLLSAYAQQQVFGAGVTLSGGEPALYSGFVEELCRYCKGYGMHTAVHTRGCVSPAQLLAAARAADLVLFELSAYSISLHERLTGINNVRILSNLRMLGAQGLHIHIKIPVIPGVNDQAEQAAGLADILCTLNGIERVELAARIPAPRTELPDGIRPPLMRAWDGAQALKAYATPFIIRSLPVHIL